MLKTKLLIAVLHVFSWLPLGAARAVGRGMGRLCWALKGRMVRITRNNLAMCLPDLAESERESLARESLMQTFSAMAEGGAIWLWPTERILGTIHGISGFDLLRRAHDHGRGVIVIGPHLGNWELLGLYLNTCGVGQTVQMFQAPDDPAFAELLYRARSRSGATMVPTDSKGVARVLATLRGGGVVGILPDQVPPASGGEFSPYFGHPALTMTLISRLLAKTGARAVMGYARRLKSGRGHGFEICFRKVDPAIYSHDLPTSLVGLNHSIEALVREEPAQYQWEYKRFKRQPPGRERPY